MAKTGEVDYVLAAGSVSVRQLTFNWTSVASGIAERTIKEPLFGILLGLITKPSAAAAPDDLYDLVLLDREGIDLLNGNGANRSATVIEQVGIDLDTGQFRPVFASEWIFRVTGAGETKEGLVQLLWSQALS